MELVSKNKFKRELDMEHCCKIVSSLAQLFRRLCIFKDIVYNFHLVVMVTRVHIEHIVLR